MNEHEPHQAPPDRTPSDRWRPTSISDAAGDPPPTSSGPRRWLAAGAVAAVLTVGGVVGVNLLSGSSPSQAATPGATSGTTATSTAANGPQRGPRPGVGGEITAIDGSTITVSSMGRKPKGQASDSAPAKKTFTVTTTAKTTFSKVTDGTVGDLAKGDTVVVDGTNSNGTIAAKQIHQTEKLPDRNKNGASAPCRGPKGDHTLGTVSAVSGSTVTISTTSGDTVKVTTTSDTKVSVIEKTSISDLAKGDMIRVQGTVSGTTVAATAVTQGPAGGPGAGRRGNCDGPGMGAQGDKSAPNGSAPSTTQSS